MLDCDTAAASAESIASADLNVIAMAISGFNGDTSNSSNHLWREQCHNLGCSLAHPYLRAIFAFLTVTDNETYDDLLVENCFFLGFTLSGR